MLETNQRRSIPERLSVVETKVSKLDDIEDKVNQIAVSVGRIENEIENIVYHLEQHREVDAKKLDQFQEYIHKQEAKSEHAMKLWGKFAMVIAAIGTLVAIYVNLKGK